MKKILQLWIPLVAGGLLLGIGGSFLFLRARSEVTGSLQKVNLWLGQDVCPEGEQKMFYPGEHRVDRCAPKELLRSGPCYGPADEVVTVVGRVEIDAPELIDYKEQCAPVRVNPSKAIRQPLIPSLKPLFQ